MSQHNIPGQNRCRSSPSGDLGPPETGCVHDCPPPCVYGVDSGQVGIRTTLGEAHVANVRQISDTFWDHFQEDQTVTVGGSDSPTSGFTVSGTVSLNTSVGANGSHTFGQGAVNFVNVTDVYQRFHDLNPNSCAADSLPEYTIQAVDSLADPGPASGTPARNPWGGCSNDPLHATVFGASTWDRDRSQAWTYTLAANLFGFNFSASDGFTNDVHHFYNSPPGTPTTYICGTLGNGNPLTTPILYNTN